MKHFQYIDKAEKLAELYREIVHQPWIAIDTEFMREKTYYPKFCLLQIATPDWVACIDPITIPASALEDLLATIYNPSIVKVFHSCRQDLEIFYHLTGKVPGPLFDTQIAAPILGFQENPGYGMLVSSILNVNLTKAHTRTDWSQRPLNEEQLKYAADDVIYLGKIYQLICQQLAELGRTEWLQEDFARLENPQLYFLPPEKAWLKVKGKNKLTGKQLSIVQALAEWREKTAISENRPRNWLIRDDLILELAKLQPETVSELSKIRGINERSVKRYGNKICLLLTEAKLRQPEKLNEQGKLPKKTQHQEAILDVLTAVVRIRADENSMNPSILGTRKDLEMLLFKDPKSTLMHGWRYSMVGKELQGIIQSHYALKIQSGALCIFENSTEIPHSTPE